MKRLLVGLSLMIVFCFQTSAMALTRMTDEQMGSISAQAGIQSDAAQNEPATPLGWITGNGLEEIVALAESFNLSLGATQTDIRIEDAVIDINHMEFDLLRTAEFSLGQIIMDGFHMEIGSANISVWSY